MAGQKNNWSEVKASLIRYINFWCHACKLRKLFAQMTITIKSTLSGNLHNSWIVQVILITWQPKTALWVLQISIN